MAFHGEPHCCPRPVFAFQVLTHSVHHHFVSPALPLPLSLPGPLVSPHSLPNNLDGNKAAERRPSKVGVSRESSNVDFSKVT